MSCFGVLALTPAKIGYIVFTRLLKHLLNPGSAVEQSLLVTINAQRLPTR
jgi:hypothetical protein